VRPAGRIRFFMFISPSGTINFHRYFTVRM